MEGFSTIKLTDNTNRTACYLAETTVVVEATEVEEKKL